MTKKVKIAIDEELNLGMDFDGYSGPLCFEEAEKIKEILKGLGVEVDVKEIRPKTESKVRQTQNHWVKE